MPVQGDAFVVTAIELEAQDDPPMIGELQGVIEQVVENLANARCITVQPVRHFGVNTGKQLHALGMRRAGIALDHTLNQFYGRKTVEGQRQLPGFDF